MTDALPSMPIEEFRRRLKALGLVVPAEREADVFRGLGLLEALAARVHQPYGYADEPSHTFSAVGNGK